MKPCGIEISPVSNVNGSGGVPANDGITIGPLIVGSIRAKNVKSLCRRGEGSLRFSAENDLRVQTGECGRHEGSTEKGLQQFHGGRS